MKILYISALSSKRVINNIYQHTKDNPGFAVQKFSRLLVRGLRACDVEVVALSNPPVPYGASKSSILACRGECEDDIVYRYVPFINIPILKHICLFINAFFHVWRWGSAERRDKAIICDVLSVSICLGALLASKISRVKSAAMVTDVYGLLVGKDSGLLSRLASALNAYYTRLFDSYILLTEQMNSLVNPRKKPHIVMEALCDSLSEDTSCTKEKHNDPRIIIYAGGIYEKYGLKMLAEGFLKANVDNAKLVYYGSGPYVEEFKSLCTRHSNLEYRGVASNEEILIEEQKATLLVNPRFSTEEFTKYSFPSKNMEYMVSGTPLLTTKLPGMPQEYYSYVFLFEEETVDGYARAIHRAMSYPESTLSAFGEKARTFVLSHKNNIKQGSRIIRLVKGSFDSEE